MKRGFTLIEVLSIIVILGIIAVLVLPKINTGVNDKKQKEYDKLAKIIENAGKSYLISHPTYVAVEVGTLLDNQYLSNELSNPFTNTNITGCVSKKVTNGINDYEFGSRCSGNINLEVDLNGGSIVTNPAGVKSIGTTINLGTPTRGTYEFAGWRVITGNSIVSANSLTIGTSHTKIKAQWHGDIQVTYNCNGGSGNSRTQLHPVDSQLIENWCSKIVEGANGKVYYFKGWSRNALATEEEYEDKANISTLELDNLTISLYAIWDELFEIEGNYEVIDDDNGNWRVKIKGGAGQTSGEASITLYDNIEIDAFLVGGGGGGSDYFGKGGGGGYTKTVSLFTEKGKQNSIFVGDGGSAEMPGGATTAFEIEVAGGEGAQRLSGTKAGSGGSGGATAGGTGGSNGSDGIGGNNGTNGKGQGKTTREFGELAGVLYSGGGSGEYITFGGSGGGGYGGTNGGGNGIENTGGGGGGTAYTPAGIGGSGIVVIRNAR